MIRHGSPAQPILQQQTIHTSSNSDLAAIRLRALRMGSRMSTIGDAANRSKRSSSPRTPVYLRIGANGFIAGRSSAPYNLSYATKFTKVSRSSVTSNVCGSPLGEDHFMGLQLDMEIVDDVTMIHHGRRNRFSIHQHFNRDQEAIDQKAVARRKVQVTRRILIAQSKASDTNWRHAPMP